MATFGEVGNIKESNAKDRTKLVEWSNGGSIATFGEVGNIKESNAKRRTQPFCTVFVLSYCAFVRSFWVRGLT